MLFDIQNINNSKIGDGYKKRLLEVRSETGLFAKGVRFIKNIVKLILRRENIIWHYVNYEVPSNPLEIVKHLRAQSINNFKIAIKNNDGIAEVVDNSYLFEAFPRLIFILKKPVR